ncbi:PP2C family protein-serine/threonine phosphatase [Indioceanicola profundi]|uniref:PP2C family protein-serine/threonine phosphatase n=1 Tax=Indioceanicola profundi TaxID=2220096 RepID=UPI000E6AA821|nr:response regulator [Indioceanicola profundi]
MLADPATIQADARRAPFTECRVLVVDASGSSRDELGRCLARIGLTRIDFAEDGEAGLARFAAAGADLVILDVDVPGMDGLELCRSIRRMPAGADLPVIIQTSPATDPAGVRSFEAGASDIIAKPINPGECMTRVRLHLEKQFLLRNLTDFHRRLEGELRLARSMQLSLIPDQRRISAVAARYGVELEGVFEPSDELGGDFWTLFELDADRLGILVADFSGHGISAAINTFRFHTLLERLPPHGYEPTEWLLMLNRPLKDLLPVGQFATCFYCIVDTRQGTLSYAAAGAPSPLLVGAGEATMLDASGLMLGITNSPMLTSDTVPFPPGATLLIYSDAMTEAVDGQGHLIGEPGLVRLATEAFQGGPGRLKRLLAAFDKVAQHPLADDLTAICISRSA